MTYSTKPWRRPKPVCDLWAQMGHRRGMTLTWAVQAEVARRRGLYDEAESLLTASPPPEGSRPVLGWEHGLGRVGHGPWSPRRGSRAPGRGRRGTAPLRRSLSRRVPRRRVPGGESSGRSARRCAAVCVHRAPDDGGAPRRVGLLVRLPDSVTADQHNARAVRQLSNETRRPTDALRDAVQNLDEAIRLDGMSRTPVGVRPGIRCPSSAPS